jgi:tRNA nucleotidyltransferase/poly(A) polymerase
MGLPIKLQHIISALRDEEWIEALDTLGDTFLVGGCVRDAYRNKPVKDIDLIVDGASMDDILEILKPFGRVDEVGESFAVIKFRPVGHTGEDYDIAVPRIERKTGTGHKGFAIQTRGVGLFDDLRRRDFTVNAIAVKVNDTYIADPYDGLTDIQRGVLRAVDPNAFIEDPLRILRGIQFAARFDYTIEPNTLALMKKHSHLIKEVSGERIFDELMKPLSKGGNTQVVFDLLYKTDVDIALFGRKIPQYEEGFDRLDAPSFFYVLGLLGGVEPDKFLKSRLKGDRRLEKAVKVIRDIFTFTDNRSDEEDLRYLIFRAFSVSPEALDAVILDKKVHEIVDLMRSGHIPLSEDDIKISGDDIKTIGSLKEGPEVGMAKRRVIRDALMNRFKWNNRQDSLEYLQELLHG